MALTLYYVDPVGGNDTTGNGTIGTPWATVQKALNTITQGAGGDQINDKAGGADVLAATLTLATYGTPTAAKPLIIRGYTAAANDGGIGDISGNSSVSVMDQSAAGKGHVNFKDMHLHASGAQDVIKMAGASVRVIDCEIDNTTGNGISISFANTQVFGCYTHNIGGGNNINADDVHFNRCESDGRNPTGYIRAAASCGHNTIRMAAAAPASTGIAPANGILVHNNSIFSNGGTGSGISLASNFQSAVNNIVEGFSGAGGKGINGNSTYQAVYGLNALYNNTTNVSGVSALMSVGADIILSGSPFTNSGTGDLSLNNTAGAGASCRAAAYKGAYYGNPFTNYGDIGAVQHQDSGGAAGGSFILGKGIIQ